MDTMSVEVRGTLEPWNDKSPIDLSVGTKLLTGLIIGAKKLNLDLRYRDDVSAPETKS